MPNTGLSFGALLLFALPGTLGCNKEALKQARRDNAYLQAQLAQERQQELERIRINRTLQAQFEAETRESEALKVRVAELRKVADERNQMFDRLQQRLAASIGAGNVAVTVRNGEMVLAMPNDILFDSGKTELKPEGKQALRQVALALKEIPDRRFHVSGHTDSSPVKTSGKSRIKDNWDLSQARALTVLNLLVGEGVDQRQLATEAHADTLPVGDNTTEDGRKQNRRIEIVIEPKLDELPAELRAFRENKG